MKQYHRLLKHILDNGTRQSNRTGIDAISVPGGTLQFDLSQGFPAVTTKRLYFKQVVGELIGFLRGYTNAQQFRDLGCSVWDQNANENAAWLANPNRLGEGDLGRIYGAQWRRWRGNIVYNRYEDPKFDSGLTNAAEDENGAWQYTEIDQIQNILTKLKTDPTNRRLIVNAWRPDELDQMALPPCHVFFQFIANVEKNELNLCLYQRSCDAFLGVPFNIASYAMLLHVVAALTGFKAATFTHFLGDAHIYVNHLDQVKLQLSRQPKDLPIMVYTGPGSPSWNLSFNLPTVVIDNSVVVSADVFDHLLPSHFTLVNYDPFPPIKAEMAV